MKYQVVGIGSRNKGVSKKDGKSYDFTPIGCISAAPGWTGHRAEEITFSHSSNMVLPDLTVGDIIDVDRNAKGYIVELTVVEKYSGKSNVKISAQQ